MVISVALSPLDPEFLEPLAKSEALKSLVFDISMGRPPGEMR